MFERLRCLTGFQFEVMPLHLVIVYFFNAQELSCRENLIDIVK